MKKMPKVSSCDVADCSYNTGQECHALAIMVGDITCPCCDTYTKASQKGGDKAAVAGVGACRATNCQFNDGLECSAKVIAVGHPHGHADCQTFQQAT